jgi:hypothetical protein
MQTSESACWDTEQENWDIPTTMNSAGIRMRRKQKITLRTGHPSLFKSLKFLGLRTKVSHAATVRVHTKKYLCAERWGGRRRELGNKSGSMVILDIVAVWYQGDQQRQVNEPDEGREEVECGEKREESCFIRGQGDAIDMSLAYHPIFFSQPRFGNPSNLPLR